MNTPSKNQAEWFRCPVYLLAEPEGGFSVYAATLPGAASQGDTETEALANITEALEGVLLSYKDLGMPIPWRTVPLEPEPGASTHWVDVSA
jgi:predicted RNase H-like HicB family nuclease